MKSKKDFLGTVLLAILFIAILSVFWYTCSSSSTSEHYDALIKNVTIVDGTGKAAYKGSIAVNGEKIVALGKVRGDADTEIDGSGLYACPGFIDPHNHADYTLLQYPLCENLVMQGITTVLAGNCGGSPAPLSNLTFGDYLAKVDKLGISVNYAPLVGHNTIRTTVMREDFKRHATAAEIEAMKTHVEEAMKSGAWGLSSFFDPSPGDYAALEEVIELAKVAAKYDGFYVPHTRHIQSQMPSDDLEEFGYGIYHGDIEDVWVGRFRGYKEAIEIAKAANIPLHIAHFSNAFKNPQPHPDFLDEAGAKATLIEIIDKAKEEGIEVTFDVIASSSTISGPRPLSGDFYKGRNVALAWVNSLTKEEFLEKIKTREFRDKIRAVYDADRLKLGMIHTKADPYWFDCFQILSCKNKEYEGKILGEIVREKKVDALELIFDMLSEDPDTTWVQFLDRRFAPGAIPVFLKHPKAMPSTDVASFPVEFEMDRSNPFYDYGIAPIVYGLYPNYIGTYVREQGILTIEEAIMKATSSPAKRFGFEGRGVLEVGSYADIVVFNLDTIKMAGDFLKPNVAPEGVECVLVNGKIVYQDKKHTGVKTGKVLKHTF